MICLNRYQTVASVTGRLTEPAARRPTNLDADHVTRSDSAEWPGAFYLWGNKAPQESQMRTITIGLAVLLALGAIVGFAPGRLLATGDSGTEAGGTMTPLERVAATPKGELKNPYSDYVSVAEEGHKKFLSASCNGCHGGGGGGGICPPLTNGVWVYGRDDDTLFRLITLGSVELQKQGYERKQHEVVVGPMPPFGQILKTDEDLWKIIAWIRSINPSSLAPPPAPPPPPQ
jgi:mono/diheme cytochrome c family protein